MTKKINIKETYYKITEESAKLGNISEMGWIDETGKDFKTIDEAVKYLEKRGVASPSYVCFTQGVWYDCEAEKDANTGDITLKNFHITATPEQEKEIFDKLYNGKFKNLCQEAFRTGKIKMLH